MLSLPAAEPHSPHKRSLGIILREEKARLMLSLPVCKSRSPPVRPLLASHSDFEFSLANASENDHNAPKFRFVYLFTSVLLTWFVQHLALVVLARRRDNFIVDLLTDKHIAHAQASF